MAESNATQVILTDDGMKIIKAQNTADNAASGITDLNDPNSMSVIEKQTQASQYAGLTSQYTVILKRAKDANISTTALTTTYTNLNTFMAAILTDTTKASDVDRGTYKILTDAYNTALSNVQTALSNSYNADISNMQSNVSVASQAASSAAIVASQAAATGDNANQAASQAASAASKASADYKTLSTGVADGSFVHITTKTVIDNAVIGTAEIVDAAITDAKIGNIKADKITAGTIDFSKIEGTNIDASKITTGKLDADRLNVGKLSAVSSDLGDVTAGSLKGVNIVANTFSTPNGSFTTDENGAITANNMTLIGGTLSTPTINAGTINGSTINGTTFNAGDIINDANNTSKFYPTTISSDGHIYTTRFNSVDAMQTDLSTGALTTKYRAINTANPNNHYEAYDTTLQADQIALFAGYTNGKDMSFTQSVTGSNQEGYVLISPLDGLTLHGDNQQITFNGTSDDVTPKGIIITPYGNINPNGTQNIWYVGNNMNMKTASFGIDGSGANNIQFNRSLDIGNFNINTYHTITSSDNGPIHFNRANGNPVDIYASTVHYDSLVKSSLLSVKRDVKKADTAYWAQLVNSIDLATYQYKTDDNTSHLRLSSIVDDVNVTKQWQLPDVFISRDEDGKLCGVDDSVLLNATLAMVQEQQKEIDQLNGHNMELEARLNKLEAKLNG
ncbi:phage tail protein [Lactiplantibacillus plantarum]|uniref:phage tail protein n=1 Tax=Lactobacillaceae TaxID=33958 RepID=UPI0009C1C0F0|nr:phage tail protein [Lactiplantibacillus plantarum]MCG0636077.1 phage tail protein [Lactiplantibacillus plantarum]MCG0642346.1 phage tail protein [Lactiplantibacillus plantarum]MCG0645496.1 phage tail protein [Lactiplantibacillus plantarum]MCG0651806.1 phage tail protein [Lactiplantibacillus plantarum]